MSTLAKQTAPMPMYAKNTDATRKTGTGGRLEVIESSAEDGEMPFWSGGRHINGIREGVSCWRHCLYIESQ